MANRHVVYNDTLAYIEEKEQAGDLFVIRPERELPVARVEKDPAKLKEAYEIGRKTASSQMNAIRQYLNY